MRNVVWPAGRIRNRVGIGAGGEAKDQRLCTASTTVRKLSGSARRRPPAPGHAVGVDDERGARGAGAVSVPAAQTSVGERALIAPNCAVAAPVRPNCAARAGCQSAPSKWAMPGTGEPDVGQTSRESLRARR